MRTIAVPEPLAQLAQEVEDAGLDRHVERGRRLVRDQDARVAGERHRDHHALPHPARELVRVLVDPALPGSGMWTRSSSSIARASRVAPARGSRCLRSDLADLLADAQHGVERGHRLLEDERDLAAAHRCGGASAARAGGRRPRSALLPVTVAVAGSSPRIESAVTLLPQPDSPTMPSTSRGASVSDIRSTACTVPVVRVEADREVLDLEQRLRQRSVFGSRTSRSPSPSRLNASAATRSRARGRPRARARG